MAGAMMRGGLVGLFAAILLQAGAGPAAAQTSGSGTITVTGTNNAAITITIGDSSAAFGTGMNPLGANTSGEITAVTGSGGTQGAYYLWTPSSAPNITVRSNATWNGTVSATANGGTSSSMTIASGVLRYCTALPASYAAAAACTALTTAASSWISNVAQGMSTYTHYLALRSDWDDTPGTFSSTVTYSVSQ